MYASAVFPSQRVDAMGVIMLVRSVFAFGCLFFINDWLARRGPLEFFIVLGVLCCVLSLGALPLYIMGKRIRYRAAVMPGS